MGWAMPLARAWKCLGTGKSSFAAPVGVPSLSRSCGLRLENGATDQFGDLRDYGVSELLKSVHPAGNPMSHSTHVGFKLPISPDSARASSRRLPSLMFS